MSTSHRRQHRAHHTGGSTAHIRQVAAPSASDRWQHRPRHTGGSTVHATHVAAPSTSDRWELCPSGGQSNKILAPYERTGQPGLGESTESSRLTLRTPPSPAQDCLLAEQAKTRSTRQCFIGSRQQQVYVRPPLSSRRGLQYRRTSLNRKNVRS